MKIHKPELTTRPIVSYSGSFYYGLGVWLDEQLQRIVCHLRSYIKSSFDLKKFLVTLALPPNCSVFTADAVSMYTNIRTPAALYAISRYLHRHRRHLADVPVNAVIEALRIVMCNNMFQFGDTFWIQLTGTAMGAPPAPTYATLAFGTHEENFLPDHEAHLVYYGRYIDDVFGIWHHHPDPALDTQLWTRFTTDLQAYDGLIWELSDRLPSINYLDIQITIQDSRITTDLYTKALNLHLYLPPRSAHPPGVLYGLVAGTVYRAYVLCSDITVAILHLKAFLRHLVARGYSRQRLLPLFHKGITNAKLFLNHGIDYTQPTKDLDAIFYRIQYHPQDPSSTQLQQLWARHVFNPPDQPSLVDININNGHLRISRFIVCYMRPPNLGNLLSYRNLNRRGPPVLTLFPEL